ncbi:hypothetical protein BDQ17DRAFT_1427265 [Cyathus striatus]|nr:hypothetical protein BDQ17DRAFT_1427265 [Cyathus striatus]
MQGLVDRSVHYDPIGDIPSTVVTYLLRDGINLYYPLHNPESNPIHGDKDGHFYVHLQDFGSTTYIIKDTEYEPEVNIERAQLENPTFDLVTWYSQIVNNLGTGMAPINNTPDSRGDDNDEISAISSDSTTAEDPDPPPNVTTTVSHGTPPPPDNSSSSSSSSESANAGDRHNRPLDNDNDGEPESSDSEPSTASMASAVSEMGDHLCATIENLLERNKLYPGDSEGMGRIGGWRFKVSYLNGWHFLEQ